MKSDAQLLDNASRIRRIPGVIVHGRYDVVCPMERPGRYTAPGQKLTSPPMAVTAPSDPPNSRALVAATDKFAG